MTHSRTAPSYAIVANSLTPYRLNLHRRLVREIPELRLWSVFTHEASNANWTIQATPDIGPVYFGPGENSHNQSRLLAQPHEWRKAGQIIRWLKAQNVRAIVLLGYNDLGRVRILRFCRRYNLPCFLFGDSNIRCDSQLGAKAVIKKVALRHLLALCSGVLYCGSLGRAYFSRYGVPPHRMFPFPYEPDYDAFLDVSPNAVNAVRRRLDIPTQESHLILYSGRLASEKRVDLLLRAFVAIAPDCPRWSLVIAGDGPLREPLRRLVPSSLSERVRWIGFIDDTPTMAALYRCCDVFVLPSDYEPWGVALTEAATSMALVCSSVVGAAADLVRDGVNGRIFPSGDLAALCHMLREVTSDAVFHRMKAASPRILQSWRLKHDPVAGLRAALSTAGVLPAQHV
jgi:glycosyltransferase involved in cell wall biosynthesis